MTISLANPHRTISEFCTTTYWSNGLACGVNDEWTMAEIIVIGGYPSYKFTRAEKHAMDGFMSALSAAYDYGRKTMRNDIRNLLGVK